MADLFSDLTDYLPNSKKPPHVKRLVNEALDILKAVGVPFIGLSPRRLECMAMSFLAVAGVKEKWYEASGASKERRLQTRQIIAFINTHFEESISSGSYDDIRRKHLLLPYEAGLILNSDGQGKATNDPKRGYTLEEEFEMLITTYGTDNWELNLAAFNQDRVQLADVLARRRDLDLVPVTLPNGKPIILSRGEHNELQRAVIGEFLPRYGYGCEVLYIGDTAKKLLHIDEGQLTKLKFFELSHDELPDIIAYNRERNWLYLIEAVHSSGPVSEIRLRRLQQLLKDTNAELIFVTAFLDKATFRKWVTDIAWETEVWIADNPDHLIHFNGHKFLGPFKK